MKLVTIRTLKAAVLVPVCLGMAALPAAQDAGTIARSASSNVGTVTKSSPGTQGAAIILLEETHTSLAGQIELAIALVRLHDHHGLRDIALEGYLKERPEIKTEWFYKAARGLSPIRRAEVVGQLLREGEISAVEFMKLTYDDVVVHPVEREREHKVELTDEASGATLRYLMKIAQLSLQDSHIPRLQALQRNLQNAEGTEKAKAASEFLKFILSVDTWTDQKGRWLMDTNVARTISAEKMLKETEEIEARARAKGAQLDADEQQGMQAALSFWRGRVAASRTMVQFTGSIADGPNVRSVALNIGAAHTDGIASMLLSQRRPYAVIRPLSMNAANGTSEIDLDAFSRKLKGQSVFSEGLAAELSRLFPVETQSKTRKKPEPVLDQPWFQAKAELYLFTSRITRRALEGTGDGGDRPPPGSGNSPPFGFGDDDLRGTWVSINPKDIVYVSDGPDGKGKAVLFRASLKSSATGQTEELWVKGALNQAFSGQVTVASNERESVETILRRHLTGAREESEKESKRKDPARERQNTKRQSEPTRKAEDKMGRVQIDTKAVAAFARSKEEVSKVALTSS